MKYDRLPKEELEKLEDEFVKFLVINGITAQDWVAIKENEPLNADQIINQFSDVVWEGVLRKTNYITKIEPDCAYFFKCEATNINLIRVLKTGDSAEYHTANKAYVKPREFEIFEMIQNGCIISDGADYEALI
jgi:hypothetical protein